MPFKGRNRDKEKRHKKPGDRSVSGLFASFLCGTLPWGFVFSSLSANLCGAYGWKVSYLLHFFALLPLAMLILFVPGKPFYTPAAGGEEKKSGGKFDPHILFYCVMGALLYMGVQVIWSNTSLWVRDSLGGTAAQIGLTSGIFSIFSCAARLVFGPVFSRLRTKSFHLSILLLASLADRFGPLAILSAALVGTSIGFTAPTCLNLGIEAMPENQVATQALMTIGFASGQFLSTY